MLSVIPLRSPQPNVLSDVMFGLQGSDGKQGGRLGHRVLKNIVCTTSHNSRDSADEKGAGSRYKLPGPGRPENGPRPENVA